MSVALENCFADIIIQQATQEKNQIYNGLKFPENQAELRSVPSVLKRLKKNPANKKNGSPKRLVFY